jgi:hypothetical protein
MALITLKKFCFMGDFLGAIRFALNFFKESAAYFTEINISPWWMDGLPPVQLGRCPLRIPFDLANAPGGHSISRALDVVGPHAIGL